MVKSRKSLLRLLPLLLLALLAGCTQQVAPPTGIKVHFVDVGQGDAVLVQGPGGENVLIDGGERQPGVLAYLKKNGVKKLDVLVATHPHSDHIGGLSDVLREVPVKEVWIDGQVHTSKTYENFLNAIDRSGAAFNEARRGKEIRAGQLVFKVLHPREPFLESLNNNSVVLHLDYGQLSFLFTGDAETEAERSILEYDSNLKSTVLKLGHHGSRTSSSEPFLDAVRPEVAVYQAGLGNSYGHPHRETINKLRRLNIRFYGTDTSGAIVISSQGQSYDIKTEKP